MELDSMTVTGLKARTAVDIAMNVLGECWIYSQKYNISTYTYIYNITIRL